MSSSIQFGVHTFIWKKEFEGTEEVIFEEAKSWSFAGVEVATHLFEQVQPDVLKGYRDKYELYLTCCTSMPMGLSLTAEDEQVWQESIGYIKKAIDFCQACEITHLSGPLIHPVGYLSGKPLQTREEERLQQALIQVADALASTNIRLALEPLNRFQGYALNTVEQGLELLQSIGSQQLGLLLDLFHMNIEEKDIPEAFTRAGDACFHIHACARDRGTPGTDSFPWQQWFEVLESISYKGWMVIESFNFEDRELASTARLWRPLAPSSAHIARDGLKFLTQTYKTVQS